MPYRNLANQSIDYQAKLRDREIDLVGVRTVIRRPKVENAFDFYGDPTSAYGPREPISLIPKYESYYQVVDLMGADQDTGMPLEALIKVSEHIPNDAIVLLGQRNDKGEFVDTWWRVMSSRIRHLEGRYARVATLTPVREVIESFDREVIVGAVSSVSADATHIPAVGGP